MTERGAVVHLDEEGDAKHEAVLRNIAHLLDDLGEEAVVELVAHGPGIGVCLSEHQLADTVQQLMARGLVVAACENTMARQSIDMSRLAAGVITVHSGVAEVLNKQWDGWAYVKP